MKPDKVVYFDMTGVQGYKEWFENDIDNWCQDHDGMESYLHNDGEKPAKICPDKHHWHCEQCNKLTQIG